MEQNQTFTVFATDAGGYGMFVNNIGHDEYRGFSLADVIMKLAMEGSTPVAWANELTRTYGGEKYYGALLDDSIAAGRLIEWIDGKYIARIPSEVGFDFKREEHCYSTADGFDKALDAILSTIGTKTPTLDKLENAEMIARDGPARPAWQPAPQPAPEPVNKPQGPHAAFFALRVDVPAGHLLGQGNPDF